MTIPKKFISEETRAKMSKSAMGHPNHNKELKGCFKSGLTPWNKGIKWTQGKIKKPRSDEFRRKQSLSHMGQPAWNKGLKGSLSHAWKGGRIGLTERIRASLEYKQWRADVFRRDGWTCQTCGLRGHGRDIEAHHIIPMRELLKEVRIKGVNDEDKYLLAMAIPQMFNTSNGITLCKDCHILTFKGERT